MARIRRTYFESISILGLDSGASPEEIKDTYRKLAKQYHPDVYKLDGGEKFKEISSAYYFLKKHPDPPQNDETPHYQRDDRRDFEQRREAYHQKQKQKKATEARRKAEMFSWLFARLRIFVYIILIFNFLLLVDFCLPRVSEEAKIVQIIAERSISRYGSGETQSGPEFSYKAQLDNGMSFRFEKEEIAKINVDETLILKRSAIFREGESVTYIENNVTVYNEFGVFKIFGILIPMALILLIAYLFFVKNDEYRLTLFLIAALIFLIQFVLIL